MRPTRALLAAAAAAALVGGCGEVTTTGTAHPDDAPKPADNGVAALAPADILAKAKAAFPKVPSVHVVGAGASDGQQFGIDLKIKNNEGATGSLDLGVGGPDGTTTLKLELVLIGQTAYLKGDDEFWKTLTGGDQLVSKLHGKWVKTTTQNERLKELLSFGDLAELGKALLEPDGKLTKGAAKEIRGTTAIGLVEAGQDGGTLYIATEGEPLPLQINEGGKSTGSVDFQDYGKPVELTAPPANLIVDEQELGS